MKIRPKIAGDCLSAANRASGEKLTNDELDAAFERVWEHREKLKAEGATDNLSEKLRTFAEQEAERTRIAAAMQRRHAALNVLIRDRLNQVVESHVKAGLTPRKALLAVAEGTQRGVASGRVSIAAMRSAYEHRYLGGLMAEMSRQVPHYRGMLRDAKMDADITREMSELREGGNPGVTGNKDARTVAELFAKYAELSRTDLNRLGAGIGKLDGWSGAQAHDDIKLIDASRDGWVRDVVQYLDIERTFPDISSPRALREALEDIYDTIVSGVPNRATAREKGQRVSPANLARQLGKSRVLHFKDANAALAYREQYGIGNTVSGIFGHLRNSARMAANMEVLGPNPEVMWGSLIDAQKRALRDNPDMDGKQRRKLINQLDSGTLKQAIDIATGLSARPDNVTAARIGSDIRAGQSMSKLGGALLSSIGEPMVTAIASQFRGSGFVPGLVRQINGIMRGRPKGEQEEIAYLFGEGFDAIIGHIVSPHAATDSPVGRLARFQEKYFKWNGLSWWTDINRSVAARVIAAEMGMRAKSAYDALPANYRHVLGLHGIDAKKWEAIRKGQFRADNGKVYVTPDRIRALDDAAIEPLVRDRIDALNRKSKTYDEQRARIIDDGRRDLELSVLRFVADETSYGVIKTDARSQRTMTMGLRPGTWAGEAIRYVAQFKGFPVSFTQRVWGRALFGHRSDASAWERGGHIGTIIASMAVAGYMSMVLKDAVKGYWPPRNPFDPKTITAALLQGGAAGIWGDFLFAEANRFGGGVLSTLAGPGVGAAARAAEIVQSARAAAEGAISGEEAGLPGASALSLFASNVPLANLFYVKPALDYLVLTSLREALSPGYLRRRERNRMRDYGQALAQPLGPPGDPFDLTAAF